MQQFCCTIFLPLLVIFWQTSVTNFSCHLIFFCHFWAFRQKFLPPCSNGILWRGRCKNFGHIFQNKPNTKSADELKLICQKGEYGLMLPLMGPNFNTKFGLWRGTNSAEKLAFLPKNFAFSVRKADVSAIRYLFSILSSLRLWPLRDWSRTLPLWNTFYTKIEVKLNY